MEFIGRDRELSTLERAYSGNASLILLTGRRRIGKTRLLKEFIKDKDALYFLATNSVESDMMQDLWDIIRSKDGTYGKPSGWNDLFSQIPNGNRRVLVIDEFSYMAKMSDGFLIRFQGIYDEILKDSGVLTILCGSHMSVMNGLSEDRNSPLYGRFDRRIILWPLRFDNIPSTGNTMDDIERYAIHGGIPRYMELLGNGLLRDDVSYNIMDPSSMMFSDPLVLLNTDAGTSNVYLSLLKAIAHGNHRSSEISSALEMPSGKLSPYISKLIEIGMIRKDIPIFENNEDTSKKGRYVISDNFTRFWFRFVHPYRSQLMRNDDSFALSRFDADFVQRHVSFVFEEICREFITMNHDIIGFVPERIGRFWNKNVEVDVIAIDTSSKKAFVGECKYRKNRAVDSHVLAELRSKVTSVKELEDYDITYGLFSISGFEEGFNESDVKLIDLCNNIKSRH